MRIIFVLLVVLVFFSAGCSSEEQNDFVPQTINFRESLEFQKIIEITCEREKTMRSFVEKRRNSNTPQFTKEELAQYKSELIALKEARVENYGTTEEAFKANAVLENKYLSPRSLELRAYFKNEMGTTQFREAQGKAYDDFFRKFPTVKRSEFSLVYSSALKKCR